MTEQPATPKNRRYGGIVEGVANGSCSLFLEVGISLDCLVGLPADSSLLSELDVPRAMRTRVIASAEDAIATLRRHRIPTAIVLQAFHDASACEELRARWPTVAVLSVPSHPPLSQVVHTYEVLRDACDAHLRRIARLLWFADRQRLGGSDLETFAVWAIQLVPRSDLASYLGLKEPGVEWRVRSLCRSCAVKNLAELSRVLLSLTDHEVPRWMPRDLERLFAGNPRDGPHGIRRPHAGQSSHPSPLLQRETS
jgi:hypothetical protein